MYLMSKVDIIKSFHLNQKLLKIITALFLRFRKKCFFKEVLATFSVCGICFRYLGTQKSVFFMKYFQRDFIRPKKEMNLCLLHTLIQTLCSGQLLKDMTDVKKILHGKDKVYAESSLTRFLTINTLRYTYGAFCTSCCKPVFSLEEKLILSRSDNLTLSKMANHLN